MIMLPNKLADKVGHDGWIPTLISGRIPKSFLQTERFVDLFSIYAVFVNAFLIMCFIISIIKDKLISKDNT